eukprot:3178357-Rhodomonas_salina.1
MEAGRLQVKHEHHGVACAELPRPSAIGGGAGWGKGVSGSCSASAHDKHAGLRLRVERWGHMGGRNVRSFVDVVAGGVVATFARALEARAD